MVGFKESPTDHYMRPFHVTAQQEYYKKHKKLCLGSRKRSTVFMEWIKQVYTTYDKVSKFVFGLKSEVSHGDNNNVETADEDLFNLLKFLNDGKYLRNTVVILMSDHDLVLYVLRFKESRKNDFHFSDSHFQNGLYLSIAKLTRILN